MRGRARAEARSSAARRTRGAIRNAAAAGGEGIYGIEGFIGCRRKGGGGGRWESERENDGKVRERGRKIAGRVGIDAVY